MFEIIVKETKQVRKIVGKKWEVVERKDSDYRYDYTPEVETVVTETNEVYRQTVESLDLVAVINAVNSQRANKASTPTAGMHSDKSKLSDLPGDTVKLGGRSTSGG